jgi:hypothetical protein
MDRHETQARVDAQINEWRNNLETMKAKAGAATGDAKVSYLESVEQLQKQFDGLKIEAAKAWDVADDSWESAGKELELQLQDWEVRAKRAWSDLTG